jgi:hypothetical protein
MSYQSYGMQSLGRIGGLRRSGYGGGGYRSSGYGVGSYGGGGGGGGSGGGAYDASHYAALAVESSSAAATVGAYDTFISAPNAITAAPLIAAAPVVEEVAVRAPLSFFRLSHIPIFLFRIFAVPHSCTTTLFPGAEALLWMTRLLLLVRVVM